METKTAAVSSRLSKTTLGAYGLKLPIGRALPDGSLAKAFTLRPWKMKEEKTLAEWKSRHKGKMTLGIYVTQILSTMVESIGGVALPAEDVERRLMISQMYIGDVMYMYVALRRAVLGSSLKMHLPCPACNGAKFDFEADLDSLDINVLERAADLDWAHDLKTPLLFSGAARSVLKLRPTAWATLESKNSSDASGMAASVIAGSIVGMKGIPDNQFTPIHESALDELTKLDLELLNKSIGMNTPGPQMGVEQPCPQCTNTFFWPIDWGYDSFFSHSSL